MSDLSSPNKSIRSRSSASYPFSSSLSSNSSSSTTTTMNRHYPRIAKRKVLPGIPKAANWGWGHLPLPAKIMVAGVLSGVISLTTPYWAYIRAEMFGLSTFGLWHYCNGEVCNSIHDNLVEGRSVEAWFHFTQGSMCIGVACSIVGLAMLTNSIEGRRLRMTPTVHMAVSSMLAISALEHFVALTVFGNYLESSGFLFSPDSVHKVDFYGSYYLGMVSFVCSLISALVVFLSRRATRRPKEAFDFSNPEHLKLLQEFYYARGYLMDDRLGPADYSSFDVPVPPGRPEEECIAGCDSTGYHQSNDMVQPENDGWYASPRN